MPLSRGEVLLQRQAGRGWWLVVEAEDGPGRVVDGPFPDRTEASWAAATQADDDSAARPVYGIRRADGGFTRRPSPQEQAFLAQLGEQLDRLPDGWTTGLSDDDPLVTLVVEVVAALTETGLPLLASTGAGSEQGGVCLTPEVALGGIVVSWRQHDRMSVEQVYGGAADEIVRRAMNQAVGDVLQLRGFPVEAFGDGDGHLVSLA